MTMEKNEMNDQIKTGKIIREIREKKGLSIDYVAKKRDYLLINWFRSRKGISPLFSVF